MIQSPLVEKFSFSQDLICARVLEEPVFEGFCLILCLLHNMSTRGVGRMVVLGELSRGGGLDNMATRGGGLDNMGTSVFNTPLQGKCRTWRIVSCLPNSREGVGMFC